MRKSWGALLDVLCVLVFIAVGRASHDSGASLAGYANAVWPFLVGGAVGWGVARVWRRPEAVWPAGVVVWGATLGVGMMLRVLSGQGTAAAFVIVASLFLGATMLGWRLAVRLRRVVAS